LPTDNLGGIVRLIRGEPNADATLAKMRHIVTQEYQSSSVVDTAVQIAVTVREKDDAAQARALLTWLRRNTRFVADPVNQQRITTPLVMLAQIHARGVTGGDCVDIAMLSACLALAIGLECRFVAEGYEGSEMHADLTHVYTIVQTGADSWVNLDTQRTPLEPDTHPVRREIVDVLD